MMAPTADAQRQPVGSGTYPSFQYYNSFRFFREGDHKEALRAFRETARSGMRTVDGAWIDAVCYRVMTGESYLRLGEPQLAIDQYNAALNIALKHREWLKRVQFPSSLPPLNRRITPAVLWGGEIRTAKYADVPERFQILLGTLDLENTVRQGGAIAPRELHSINVHEVIRCTCLALRRRYELLGPVAAHDPLTMLMVGAFDGRMGPPNHWTQAWLNVQRGWALACAGKSDEAKRAFKASVLLSGRYDHPLTATALMGLGHLTRDAGEPGKRSDILSAQVWRRPFTKISRR